MVLRERTSSIRSVWKGCSGNGNRRGCSSAKACATVRALSSGQERWCATFTPHQRLAIAFRQRGEDAASPEGISYVPNRPFHATFLISRPYLARTWREVIVRGQFQQPRVEMNLVAAAFQHRTAEIVVLLWRLALCGGHARAPRRSGRKLRIREHNYYSDSSHFSRSASLRHPPAGRHSAERSTG